MLTKFRCNPSVSERSAKYCNLNDDAFKIVTSLNLCCSAVCSRCSIVVLNCITGIIGCQLFDSS